MFMLTAMLAASHLTPERQRSKRPGAETPGPFFVRAGSYSLRTGQTWNFAPGLKPTPSAPFCT